MSYSLLSEVEKLEKHSQEVLLGLAANLKGAPLPPQYAKLARAHKLLMEIRTSLETPEETAPAGTRKGDSGAWGTAFRGPAPDPAASSGADMGSVSTDWINENEGPEASAAAPQKLSGSRKPPSGIKKPQPSDGDEAWKWDDK